MASVKVRGEENRDAAAEARLASVRTRRGQGERLTARLRGLVLTNEQAEEALRGLAARGVIGHKVVCNIVGNEVDIDQLP